MTLAVIPPGTKLQPKKPYLLAYVGDSDTTADQYFTQQLTAPPFILALLSPTNEVISSANILSGYCPSGPYIPGIAGGPFVCTPLSGGE